MGAALAKLPYGGDQPIVRLIAVPSRPTTHRNANGAQAGSEFRLGNAWTRHHDFAGAGEGDITRPTLHRVARLDRLRHVVGLVASVLRSFERPISAISVGILRPHSQRRGQTVGESAGDRQPRCRPASGKAPSSSSVARRSAREGVNLTMPLTKPWAKARASGRPAKQPRDRGLISYRSNAPGRENGDPARRRRIRPRRRRSPGPIRHSA
jgi:hypothetical protein